MSHVARFLFLLALLASTVAQAQKIPPDLQAGADFLWQIGTAKKPADVYASKNVILPRDASFESQLSAVHKSLSSMQGTLIPEVDVIKQYYLERGEQLTIFRVQSNRYGSRFFEIHIFGANRPPKIIALKELDAGAVVQRVQGKEILSIPQR